MSAHPERRAFPRPARIEPDCSCEVTVERDGDERLPRVVRWSENPLCPVHGYVNEAWQGIPT